MTSGDGRTVQVTALGRACEVRGGCVLPDRLRKACYVWREFAARIRANAGFPRRVSDAQTSALLWCSSRRTQPEKGQAYGSYLDNKKLGGGFKFLCYRVSLGLLGGRFLREGVREGVISYFRRFLFSRQDPYSNAFVKRVVNVIVINSARDIYEIYRCDAMGWAAGRAGGARKIADIGLITSGIAFTIKE